MRLRRSLAAVTVVLALTGTALVTVAQAAAPSAPRSVTATSATTPSPPTSVEAYNANGSILVKWDNSEDDGGSEITDYTARARTNTALDLAFTCHPRPPLEAEACILRVPNGYTYLVDVLATNAVGNSAFSTPPVTIVMRDRDSATKSIEIAGERGTGKDRIRIYVEGVTTGLPAGTKLVPQFLLSGQEDVSSGTAQPTVDDDGSFTWSRKAKKQIFVWFSTESGDVLSELVKIPARR
ncbi:MAG: hypothetical protein RL347_242 [Actinomycetota bacterium]